MEQLALVLIGFVIGEYVTLLAVYRLLKLPPPPDDNNPLDKLFRG